MVEIVALYDCVLPIIGEKLINEVEKNMNITLTFIKHYALLP